MWLLFALQCFPNLNPFLKLWFWKNRFKSRTWVSSSEHSDAQVTSLYRIPSQVIKSQSRNMVDLSSRHGFNPKYLAKLQGRKRPNSMKLFNYMKMGPEMFLYLYWRKKHHPTHPCKPTQDFKGFDTIILYVQLSASSKVGWQLDQLSIIDPISWKTFILVSNIHGACVIYRIQVWQIYFFVTLDILDINFELIVCVNSPFSIRTAEGK